MDTQPRPVNAVVPEWTVGDRLRKARLSKKLLREQVCAKDSSGEISPRMLGNFEANITIPKDSMVAKLALLLETDKTWLTTGIVPGSPEELEAKAAAAKVVELPDTARRLELIESLLIAVVGENKKFVVPGLPDVVSAPEIAIGATDSGGKK